MEFEFAAIQTNRYLRGTAARIPNRTQVFLIRFQRVRQTLARQHRDAVKKASERERLPARNQSLLRQLCQAAIIDFEVEWGCPP